MDVTTTVNNPESGTRWLTTAACDLADFVAIVEQQTRLEDYPHAAAIAEGVVVFESDSLRQTLLDPAERRQFQAELADVFLTGPGIAVFTGAVENSAIDQVSEVFRAMIADQRTRGVTAGDHYAKPGANDRVWNAIEKLAICAPEAFAAYYASDVIATAATAWLGPGYQVTSQVNVVNPGGDAQRPHRDYHLGFLSDEGASQYPSHVHHLSPVLTLQGAVAHCDMPVESGPTMYLPHSQKYEPGYLAWRRSDFREYFAERHVQLPLSKGDAVFFNPALFHAAGHNRTADIKRMANLLQISSAFGRAMESVDRQAMSTALFPTLLRMRADGIDDRSIRNIIAACAEGYAFPTNLDRDQPIDGLAPPSQADHLWRAVTEQWSTGRLSDELAAYAERRNTAAR